MCFNKYLRRWSQRKVCVGVAKIVLGPPTRMKLSSHYEGGKIFFEIFTIFEKNFAYFQFLTPRGPVGRGFFRAFHVIFWAFLEKKIF